MVRFFRKEKKRGDLFEMSSKNQKARPKQCKRTPKPQYKNCSIEKTLRTVIYHLVMLDPNGNNRGSGFVAFSTPEEASQAAKMSGKMVVNKPLYVALAQRKEERRAKLQVALSISFIEAAQSTYHFMQTSFVILACNLIILKSGFVNPSFSSPFHRSFSSIPPPTVRPPPPLLPVLASNRRFYSTTYSLNGRVV
ncbi:hypothetical protein L2E82_32380 [Cichorium intybus]|uniref:Uncharacterized protein n=1 Tax=Cichorium intybus TaxID=13427 RepID=A0ACB9BGM6_CICIN|nr:hypothetical protein L2E82_32380 [Cichorium intybus]